MAGTLTKDQILDGISELSVLELSELLKDFEERFGVTAAAPVAVAAAPAAGGGADSDGGEDEKSEFDVILTGAGDKRSRSSRRCVLSPAWASRRPRTWWTAPPSPSWKRPTRKTPRRQRPSSRELAPASSSSSPVLVPVAGLRRPGHGDGFRGVLSRPDQGVRVNP